MNDVDTKIAAGAALQAAGQTILSAFRFLDDVGNQIEALRTTLKAQVVSCEGLKKLGIKADHFREDDEESSSKWLFRTTIDTFEIFKTGKKGRPKPVVYCAFQISLAPSQVHADQEFFPHVAVLLAGASDEIGPWAFDEFELDDDFLKQQDEPWEKAGERRWTQKNGDPWVAFVVPLVELKNENDVRKQVLDPMVTEVYALLQKMATSGTSI